MRVASVAGSAFALGCFAILALMCWIGWRSKKIVGKAHLRLQLLADAAQPRLRRQAFLSHTGQDEVAKHFTASVLKPALELAGLQVVIDYEFLKPGMDWSQELVTAAANSAVFIAVLSRSYTQRFWCMLELDLALNARRLRAAQQREDGSSEDADPWIIPVFLDDCDAIVQQDRIRQHWSAARPQQAHAREGRHEAGSVSRMVQWVDAECWAANVAAMHRRQDLRLASFAGKDALHQLARSVVQAAQHQLPVRVWADEGPVVVGLEDRVAKLVAELSSGRLGTWLHGPGGSGKTTLGKRLFNQLLDTGLFQCSAIVEVEHDDGDDKTKLAGHLRSLLKTLKRLTGKKPSGTSAAELARQMKEEVVGRKVLYMLDNVWTPQQLAHLLPTQWGKGSIVIITSRSTTINCPALNQVKDKLLFTAAEMLDLSSARQLLRTCAGLARGPPAGLQHLEDSLLQRCAGLPLALTIVGGSLHNNTDLLEWKAVLAALAQGTPAADMAQELQGVVAHSLRGLQPQAVSMFLDVATVLRGWPVDYALAIWEGWHGLGARGWFMDLLQRSLVSLDADRDLVVHDVVVVLGRRMVLDSGSPYHGSRLWVEEGRVVGVPAKGQAHGCKVLAARLDILACSQDVSSCQARKDPPPKLHPAAADMDWSEVRILVAGRVGVPVPASALWVEVADWQQLVVDCPAGCTILDHATELRGLWVDDCSIVEVLPACLQEMTGLVALHLGGCCSLVDGVGQLPASLQGLRLVACSRLAHLPDALGRLTSLRGLQLKGCSQLVALPGSVGRLTQLTCLSLAGCSQLVRLSGLLGQLSALRELHLTDCSRITELPAAIGRISALQTLILEGSSCLTSLPDSLGQVTLLTYLDLAGCGQLVSLPESLAQLVSLRELWLDDCSSLTALPDAVAHMLALQKLVLKGCSQLAALPDDLGRLSFLTGLSLEGCRQLSQLPESLGQLASLRVLYLSDCSRIAELPNTIGHLSAVQTLVLKGCSQLAVLPNSLGHLTLLTNLDLGGCSQLASLPESLGQLVSLHVLWLTDCSRVMELPRTAGHLSALHTLVLKGCGQLAVLPCSLGQMALLANLDLEGCSSLTSLPESLAQLVSLHELYLNDCSSITQLPGAIGRLSALKVLVLDGCSQLTALPESLGRLTMLALLRLSGCKQLSSLPDSLGQLASLSELYLSNCRRITKLPGTASHLTMLQRLDLLGCSQLAALPECVGQLTSLRYLNLEGCSQLATLPDSLGQVVSLHVLWLTGCCRISALPDTIGHLMALQMLALTGCSQLASLPDSLGQLTQLTYLSLAGCSLLAQLPESFDELVSLRLLLVRHCSKLALLPSGLGHLTSLRHLDLCGCLQLAALPDTVDHLKQLTTLDFDHCSCLAELPDSIGYLASLRLLDLRDCTQLKSLPDTLGQLVSLVYLRLRGCGQLAALPESIGSLTALRQLHLSGCSKLVALPESMARLASLEQLHLSGCTRLAVLPASVGQLPSLQQLTLKGCEQLLRHLPGDVQRLLVLSADEESGDSDCEPT